MSYASFSPNQLQQAHVVAQYNEVEFQRAIEHKERLLEFDRSSAKRTVVFDDQSDYIGTHDWLSPQEKESLVKAAAERALQKEDAATKRILTLDFAGRRVNVDSVGSPADTISHSNGNDKGNYSNHKDIDNNRLTGVGANPNIPAERYPLFVSKRKPQQPSGDHASEAYDRNIHPERIQHEYFDAVDAVFE